jgi:hypothetical protein
VGISVEVTAEKMRGTLLRTTLEDIIHHCVCKVDYKCPTKRLKLMYERSAFKGCYFANSELDMQLLTTCHTRRGKPFN